MSSQSQRILSETVIGKGDRTKHKEEVWEVTNAPWEAFKLRPSHVSKVQESRLADGGKRILLLWFHHLARMFVKISDKA